MNVLYMLNKISLIPDLMFPKTTLPHRLLLFAAARGRDLALIGWHTVMAKVTFDEPPPSGKIFIPSRQSPHTNEEGRVKSQWPLF